MASRSRRSPRPSTLRRPDLTISSRFGLLLLGLLPLLGPTPTLRGQDSPAAERLFIREFRVQGATVLPAAEVQRAVYPYLGPGRTPADIDAARAALETLYREKGYQAATVEVPAQRAKGGLIVLRVTEGEIGRLRIVGSRYHDIEKIRAAAPSLAEGAVPEFNAISRDLVALNQQPDRRVTPEIRPGAEPGMLDVDLKVEDTLPLQASAELNNRSSSGTTRLRLNLAASYDNLWQLGHSVGANAQTSPQDWDEVLVYSAFYRARFEGLPEWSYMLTGTKQETDISTLGGTAVAGRGESVGLRSTRVLAAPADVRLFHSVSFGLDYKKDDQAVDVAGVTTTTPLTYFPLNLTYGGFLAREHSETEFFTGLTLHFRGLGSDAREFDQSRFNAGPCLVTLRGDVTHTRKLPPDAPISARLQGQLASGPLINKEQFAAGGLDTVRGYLEGEVLGDHGLVGSLELVSPNLAAGRLARTDFKALLFADGGHLRLTDPLPEQTSSFDLASVGAGFRFRLFEHFDGALYFAVPFVEQTDTEGGEPHFTFVIKSSL